MDINIISRQKEHTLPPCTFEEGRNILAHCVKNILPQAKFTEEEKNIVNELLKYFLNMDGLYDLNKGLFIYGYYGTGKTKLMQIFYDFTKALHFNHFRMLNYKTLLTRIRTEGFETMRNINTSEDISIDDLGFANQSEINYYGNKINTLSDIVYGRYVKFEYFNTRTYYTSNLLIEGDKASIRSLYGDGIAGRIMDSCNIILYDYQHHR